MFDKSIERNITNNGEVTIYGLIDKELERCWSFIEFNLHRGGSASQGNIQSIYKKIEALHDLIETLVEKSPDTDVYKTIKDLQEHVVEQTLLKEE